jgi:hypothetical protein
MMAPCSCRRCTSGSSAAATLSLQATQPCTTRQRGAATPAAWLRCCTAAACCRAPHTTWWCVPQHTRLAAHERTNVSGSPLTAVTSLTATGRPAATKATARPWAGHRACRRQRQARATRPTTRTKQVAARRLGREARCHHVPRLLARALPARDGHRVDRWLSVLQRRPMHACVWRGGGAAGREACVSCAALDCAVVALLWVHTQAMSTHTFQRCSAAFTSCRGVTRPARSASTASTADSRHRLACWCGCCCCCCCSMMSGCGYSTQGSLHALHLHDTLHVTATAVTV